MKLQGKRYRYYQWIINIRFDLYRCMRLNSDINSLLAIVVFLIAKKKTPKITK